jgi:hypothetical protein
LDLEPEDFLEDEDLEEPDLEEDFLIFDFDLDLYPEELELEPDLLFDLYPEDDLLLGYFLIL